MYGQTYDYGAGEIKNIGEREGEKYTTTSWLRTPITLCTVQHPRISEGRHASSNYLLNPHLCLRLLGSLYRHIPCPRPHMAVAIKPQYVYMWPHKALEDYHLFVLLRGSTSPQRKKSSTFRFSISYGLKAGSAKACFAAVYCRVK